MQNIRKNKVQKPRILHSVHFKCYPPHYKVTEIGPYKQCNMGVVYARNILHSKQQTYIFKEKALTQNQRHMQIHISSLK